MTWLQHVGKSLGASSVGWVYSPAAWIQNGTKRYRSGSERAAAPPLPHQAVDFFFVFFFFRNRSSYFPDLFLNKILCTLAVYRENRGVNRSKRRELFEGKETKLSSWGLSCLMTRPDLRSQVPPFKAGPLWWRPTVKTNGSDLLKPPQ